MFKRLMMSIIVVILVSANSLSAVAMKPEFANVKDQEALDIYSSIVSNNKRSGRSASKNNYNVSDVMSELNLSEDFRVLSIIGKFNRELNTVYEKGEDGSNPLYTRIFIDNETGLPVLLQIDNIENTILMIVGGEPFKIYNVGEDVLVETQNGHKTYLIKSEIDNTPFTDEQLNNLPPIRTARGYWLNERGPFKKTNRIWMEVLSIISWAAGGASVFTKIPLPWVKVVGIVLFVAGTALKIGDWVIATIYIVYYQAGISDCPTYIRERQLHYADSNYSTGYIDSGYVYFHSVNPDSVGGTCWNY